MEYPTGALNMIDGLTPKRWDGLIKALKDSDRKKILEIFSSAEEEAEANFKAIKERARIIVDRYPEVADPRKI